MSASRREFLKLAGLAALPLMPVATLRAASETPWYRRVVRWGQTNLTEIDPPRLDIDWWRAHWKRTRIQGVVLNAGGIVAYYPTQVPFHRRARELGTRDVFGELTRAAREDGLAVFARMDSNRADEALFRAHPDWFARDAQGAPYLVTGLHVACVNGPYYREHIPAILREIASNYRPDGFTDNNWNGPTRSQPCFCANCEAAFRARTGAALPRAADWDAPLYREWILWNYARRLEIWDEFNLITREAGGPDCIWVGMMAGAQNWQSRVFRDDREIYRRTEIIMLDHQRRFDAEGFQNNSETGLRLHSVGGWNKLIPESTAMYHLGENNFRLAMKPEPEVRLWALEAFAGGIQPWWHHVGAVQEDRRMFATAEPLFRWHEQHQDYLLDRRPVANVGVLWSQRNMDFFGRDAGAALVDEPWNGCAQALLRARIPYVPVHIDDIERVSRELGLTVLVLPNLGAMSDSQAAAIRAFVAGGGNLLATGLTSACDEWGEARPDLALADLFGASLDAAHFARSAARRLQLAQTWQQTYLRLPTEGRHEVLAGFANTDLLAFGGVLEPLRVAADANVALTYVPPVPVSPPEDVWMREPRTTIAALILRTTAGGARIAYLPADIDRRFARDQLPDHGALLAGLTRWAARDDLPFTVSGAGLVDCKLWKQGERLILHVVNLNNANTWRTPVHELTPIGPLRVRLRSGTRGRLRARSLVDGTQRPLRRSKDGWIEIAIERVLDHEVLVLES
jgi:hypothetical protein